MAVAAIVLLTSLPVVVVLALRPVERRLALRYPRRRPVEALLVMLGACLGTGIITGSLVVGDTIDRSIRAGAYEQLGPTDEVVAVSGLDGVAELEALVGGFRSENVDGLLVFVSSPAAVASAGPGALGQPRAQLLEVDFPAARSFGNDPGATGIEGDTPAQGAAAVTADLADRIDVEPGDPIRAFAYGQIVELTVDRVLPRRGVAGFWPIDARQRSYNVLVGPGTLQRLLAAADGSGSSLDPSADLAEPPTAYLAVSNVGGVESGADRTDAVTAELEAQLGDLAARVQPVKRDTLDQAETSAASLSQLYFTLGMFAVAAGILLLVNIFVMLTDERRSELGMLRALGLRRLPLVAAFATEGWLYSIGGSALGMVLGLGFGRVIAWRADQILAGGDEVSALELTFTWSGATLIRGFTIGFCIALATIVLTSARVSRLNVIAAIRDLPSRGVRRVRRRWRLAGQVMILLGTGWTILGIAAPDEYGVMVGPMVVLVGLIPVLARRLPIRPVAAVAAVAVLVWATVFIAVLGVLDIDVSIPVFLVQGLTMAAAAVSLVTLYQGVIGRWVARLGRGSLAVRVGLAYPIARRFRTGMTLAMIAIVVLTLVYLAIISRMFSNQVDDITADLSGGFGVVVTSNPTAPVPVEQLEAAPGVTAVAPLGYTLAEFTVPGDEPVRWPVTGFGPELAAAPPALADLGGYESARDAWQATLDDPSLIVVDEFFLVTSAGPPANPLDPGDTVTITDPVSGRSRELTVAALAEPDFLANGGFYGWTGYGDVFGERATRSRFFVAAAGQDAAVDTIRRLFLANGADAETVRSVVETALRQSSSFFTLMQQFVGVGLVVGIAGVGVIMVRAVRERRRQVGILRSLGFQPRAVAGAFMVEAGFVAVEGVVIGVLVALIGSYGLVASGNNFTESFDWTVPVSSVAIIVAIALVASVLAAVWPASRAARIRPAVALRISD